MPKDKLTDYSATAASNTDIGGIDLGEGTMTPSSINNALREQMSHLKDFADGTTGIDVLNLQDDDNSASIKLQAPSAVTTTVTFTLPDGDGTSGQFLQTDGSANLSWGTVAASSLFASGMVIPYAGSSAPSGWLLAYGQAVSRTTYSDLFSVISTTYGAGDGSTTFNLPDLRGRVVAGQDDMGGVSADRLTDQSGGLNGDTLGDTGGSETHTLTEAQLASHTHAISSITIQGISSPGSGTRSGLSFVPEGTGGTTVTGTTGATVGGTTFAHTASLANTGSDSAHNNVQPTIILNYIIKT
jgi:microcystin-dependent protein